MQAGLRSGDLVFPIPFCPELHFSEFSSAVADMKNSVADRSNAQSSCAGLFIAAHLGFDFPGNWIHVDMATPVHSVSRIIKPVESSTTGVLIYIVMSQISGRTCYRIWSGIINYPLR